MSEKLPEDLKKMGDDASKTNMSPEVEGLLSQGFELVDDDGLLAKVEIIPADGVVEEPDVTLSSDLENDDEHEYKVVMDKSGVSEVMHGKPKFVLLRKKK